MRITRRLGRMGLTLALLGTGIAAVRAQADNAFTLPPPAGAVEAMRLSYYAYDRALPLNAALKPLDDSAIRARYHLAYDSIHDLRVTALLALPKRAAAPALPPTTQLLSSNMCRM